jgi:hypothetical protein
MNVIVILNKPSIFIYRESIDNGSLIKKSSCIYALDVLKCLLTANTVSANQTLQVIKELLTFLDRTNKILLDASGWVKIFYSRFNKNCYDKETYHKILKIEFIIVTPYIDTLSFKYVNADQKNII